MFVITAHLHTGTRILAVTEYLRQARVKVDLLENLTQLYKNIYSDTTPLQRSELLGKIQKIDPMFDDRQLDIFYEISEVELWS